MTTSPPHPHRPPRKSGVVIPHRASLPQRLLARTVVQMIRLLVLTLRFKIDEGLESFHHARSSRVIFAIWHNRLALSLFLYNRYIRRQDPGRHLAAIVSASRDGGLLARILELFGVQPVRGSTSRRGHQALRELVTRAEQGDDLAITPDGPRGPPYVVQDGAIFLAS